MRSNETLAWQAYPPKGALPHIIYALATALLPFIDSIFSDHTQRWTPRTRHATRINRILHQLLALVARMHPNKVGPTAFTKLRTRPTPNTPPATTPPATTTLAAPPTTRAPRRPRATPRRQSTTLLSARRVAARIAALLRELEAEAIAAGHPLPQHIRDLCAQAIAAAGCNALPPNHYKPKTGLFAETMVLPPWFPLRL